MNAAAHPLVLDTQRASRRSARQPSKDLPALCSDFIAMARAFDASDATCEDDDPSWRALQAAEDRISKRQPKTMADLVALAKLAEFHARQPNGSMNYGESFTGDVPARIVKGLLRLCGHTGTDEASHG